MVQILPVTKPTVYAVKCFKKASPNGKLTAYLSRRDFVDHLTHTVPVDGVVVVDDDYLKGRNVFGKVCITYRYGREEDEMMGLHFSKEYELLNTKLVSKTDGEKLSIIQNRMIEKMGPNARPFTLNLPENAPTSVSLETKNDEGRPLGVLYELIFYVAEDQEEKPHRRNSIRFAVRKVQYAPVTHNISQPSTVVSRGFTFSSGKLTLEVSLDRDIYLHGDVVHTLIKVQNATKKTVKRIVVEVVQHVDVTMINTSFTRIVGLIGSCEGCPITPNTNYEKKVFLTLHSNKVKHFGVALDGRVKDQDANLASSTIAASGKNVEDALGIVVFYSVRVKLLCGAISGNLTGNVAFKLMHPNPDGDELNPDDPEPKESKPNDPKPKGSKSDYPKPKESKPDDFKSKESKPDDSKPKESKPDDPKPKESKTDDPKPIESKPDDTKPKESTPDNPAVKESKPDDPEAKESKPDNPEAKESKPDDPEAKESKPDNPEIKVSKPDDPEPNESKPDDPETKDSKLDDPEAKESKPGDPEIKESKPDDPETKKSKPDDPETKESKHDDPETKESKPDDPETKKSKPDDSETKESKPNDPETKESKPNDPETKESKPEVKLIVEEFSNFRADIDDNLDED